jgi:hypothetical protein
MSKSVYLQQFLTTITAIAQSASTANTLVDAYFDRGYGAGGTDEIVADDLAAYDLTPAQIASGITLFQQLQALRNNQAVTSGDYDATLNVLRRDL